MLFCKKCGSILIPKKGGSRRTVLACSSCGAVNKQVHEAKIRENVTREDKNIGVIESTESSLPLTSAECPKCGHSKAYYWSLQTRAGDEPETKFLRCGKCRHTWREYD